MKSTKQTNKTSKLTFHKETIRRLTSDQLGGVAGGRNCTDESCSAATFDTKCGPGTGV
jgi:hypothetical protein